LYIRKVTNNSVCGLTEVTPFWNELKQEGPFSLSTVAGKFTGVSILPRTKLPFPRTAPNAEDGWCCDEEARNVM
jgi:L,D-peptidoglycan transpeptidase YkuD (ErfK/YbiS/YcfS/YnhG family)